LVGVDGVSRLTDFGIAKSISQVGATATGIIKGKVNYMAPEQALGKHVDRRCDVWAAGVVAWEMFAGRRLFKEANDAAVLLRIVSNEKPPRLSGQRGDINAELDGAVSAALVADMDARLPDADALRQRVIAALAGEGGLAEHEEVARYVSEVAAAKLAERRDKVAEVLALRDQLHEVSRAAEQMARREVESISSHVGPAKVVEERTAVMDEPTEDMRTHIRSTTPPQPLSPAKREAPRALIIGAAAAAALAIGWLSVALTRGGHETAPLPADGTATAAPVEASSPAPSAPPRVPSSVPSASANVAAAAGPLEVSANAPIAQLRIGSRNIVLGEPVTKLEVLLKDDERDVALTLTAITRDGRKVEHELKPGERSADLSFGGRVRRPPPPGTGKKPPPKSGPGLADSPY
jgi:serine/threonine-protein kinase